MQDKHSIFTVRSHRRGVAVAAGTALLGVVGLTILAGCGSGGRTIDVSSAPAPTPTASATPTPTPSATATPTPTPTPTATPTPTPTPTATPTPTPSPSSTGGDAVTVN